METIKKQWHLILLTIIFLLAVLLRVKTYLLANPLWHDEHALAGSLMTRNLLGFFQPLEYDQKAPSLFMILNKLIYYIGGENLISLKFIPFISGITSIFVFYLLSKKVLNTKLGIVIANFLFAINFQLIYWTQKFKQYSFDVLLFTTGALFFTNIDLEKASYKKCLLYSLISLILILSSFPCTFIIYGFILYTLLGKINFKKILVFSAPILTSSIIYYLKVLKNIQSKEVTSFPQYWETGFLKLDISSFLLVFKENFNFFFVPNNLALIGLILFITGLILSFKNKNRTTYIILCSFLGIFFASLLHVYPIFQRTALYLLPVSILFITKPLDIISKNKKIISTIIICLLIGFFTKYNFSYVRHFFSPDIFQLNDGITTFPILAKKYDKNDILVLNSTTQADFIYYSKIYHFKAKKMVLFPIMQYDEEYYQSLLKQLPKNNTYWFIFGWEYSHRINDPKNSIAEHLMNYIKNNHLKIIEQYKDNNSILIKVKM